jgi:outer membrane receptor protein involved in Fe transport
MTTIATASGGEAYIDGYNTWLTTIDALELGFDWDLGSDSTLGFKAGNSTFVLDPQTNYNVVGDDITGNVRENASRHFNLSYETIFNKYADFKAHVGLVDNYQDLFMRNPSSGESTCPNSTYNGALQSNINLPFNNTLTVGMDASKGRMVSEDLSTGSLQSTKGTLLSAGAFVQDEFKAFDFLIFYAGARYDYWKAMDAKNNSAEGSNISDRTRNYVSPKGSIVILPDDKTTIRGTVGESFRAPVLNEMFTYRMKPSDGSTTMPNLRLKPETALTYEGNVERIFFDRLTLGASYFSIHLDDMIYKVTINTDGDSQNQNIAEAWSKGYELSIRCKVIDGVTLFANQTHTDTRISKDTRYDALERLEGKQFTSTPQDIYNYGCDVKYAGFFGNVQAKSVGDQYYEEDNSDIFDHSYGGYDRYTIVDATVGYKFLKNCSLAVSVSNIGDRKYWDGTDRNPGRTYMVKGTASF